MWFLWLDGGYFGATIPHQFTFDFWQPRIDFLNLTLCPAAPINPNGTTGGS